MRRLRALLTAGLVACATASSAQEQVLCEFVSRYYKTSGLLADDRDMEATGPDGTTYWRSKHPYYDYPCKIHPINSLNRPGFYVSCLTDTVAKGASVATIYLYVSRMSKCASTLGLKFDRSYLDDRSNYVAMIFDGDFGKSDFLARYISKQTNDGQFSHSIFFEVWDRRRR